MCGNRLTHYHTTHFRLFQTERVCRRQFQIDENGRKPSKWVENTVGKGEIARDKQFLLFPLCFQKACFPEVSKGNGLRDVMVLIQLTHYQMTKFKTGPN